MSLSRFSFISFMSKNAPWGLSAISLWMNNEYHFSSFVSYIVPITDQLVSWYTHPCGGFLSVHWCVAQSFRILTPFVFVSCSVYSRGFFLSFLSFLFSRVFSSTDTRIFISTALITFLQSCSTWDIFILWSFSILSAFISFFRAVAWCQSIDCNSTSLFVTIYSIISFPEFVILRSTKSTIYSWTCIRL